MLCSPFSSIGRPWQSHSPGSDNRARPAPEQGYLLKMIVLEGILLQWRGHSAGRPFGIGRPVVRREHRPGLSRLKRFVRGRS